jgi:uncharacterized protein
MNYLITGATGFIGKPLVELLLREGHSVHYLGRKQSRLVNSRAVFHLWADSVGTLPPLETVPPCDAVIHLAGEPVAQRWNAEVKRKIRESRINSTRNLVEAIGKLTVKPPVLVNASAIGYYGERGDEILPESSSPGSGFLAEACIGWEREADRAREFGLRVVKVRIGIVLGRDGGALPQMLPSFRFGAGGTLGSGEQWMSWIHRDDLIGIIRWAAETPTVEGAVNGTAPEPVTNAEFTRRLAKVLRRPALFRIPRLMLRLVLGQMSDSILASARAIPQKADQQGFTFRFPTLEPALRNLLD